MLFSPALIPKNQFLMSHVEYGVQSTLYFVIYYPEESSTNFAHIS
jgi:hypothetical protein